MAEQLPEKQQTRVRFSPFSFFLYYLVIKPGYILGYYLAGDVWQNG